MTYKKILFRIVQEVKNMNVKALEKWIDTAYSTDIENDKGDLQFPGTDLIDMVRVGNFDFEKLDIKK